MDSYENKGFGAIVKGKRVSFLLKALGALGVIYAITLMLTSSAPTFAIPSSISNSVTTSPSSADSYHTLGVQPDTRNVAAIVETRPLMSMAPLILHFSSVLGAHWPIHVFTSTTKHLQGAAMKRAIDMKSVIIHILPPNITEFSNRDSVSEFLTTPWLWEQLAPAGHVLLFQTDSILCANAPMLVDDFLKYDFVGAPITRIFPDAAGYNGGLSLRNRPMMLDVVNKVSWKDEQAAAADPENHDVRMEMRYEDQWFYQKMLDMPPKADGSPYANLPDQETAKKFSVETIWYETPIGYHQVGRWDMAWTPKEERIKHTDKYCPEWSLATKEEIADR